MNVSKLSDWVDPQDHDTARAVLSKCVHCGLCNATCPTYQVAGNELDGPRGRIYLIKHMLEDGAATAKTQFHLDRCLSCLSCETTCPSGVKYGTLLKIGKKALEDHVSRPPLFRLKRKLVLSLFLSPRLLDVIVATIYRMRWLLPASVRAVISPIPVTPLRTIARNLWEGLAHIKIIERIKRHISKKNTVFESQPQTVSSSSPDHTVLLLRGCVQDNLTPQTNRATIQVLKTLGHAARLTPRGCCGALLAHSEKTSEAEAVVRQNIDLWLSAMNSGSGKLITTASGCAAFIKTYPTMFHPDDDYLEKAHQVSENTIDIAAFMESVGYQGKFTKAKERPSVAMHCPCTLQHSLKQQPSTVQTVLDNLGFDVKSAAESHLCCGSAGSYSLFQPEMAHTLRERKLKHLRATQAQTIATANVGCQLHLSMGAKNRVYHWIELVADQCLPQASEKHSPARPES